jgi:hypothetical protein
MFNVMPLMISMYKNNIEMILNKKLCLKNFGNISFLKASIKVIGKKNK